MSPERKDLMGEGKRKAASRVLGYCAMHSCRKLLPATDNLSHHRNLAIIHLPSPSITRVPEAQTAEGIL